MSDKKFNWDTYEDHKVESKDGFNWDDYNDSDDESEISKTESFLRGAGQEGTFGFSDEIIGGLNAAKEIALGDPTLDQFGDVYEKERDSQRELNRLAEEANPATYTTGQVAGGIGSMFLPGIGAVGKISQAAKGAKGLAGLGKAVGLGAVEGGILGGASGVGHSEAEDVAGMASDALDYAQSGALVGGGIPLALKGLVATGKGAKVIGNKVLDIMPAGSDIRDAFKFGTKGESLLGKEVLPKINKELENTVSDIANKLDQSKDAASKQIGRALNELNTGNVNGPALINETEALLNEARKTANDEALKAIEATQKKLDQYKKLVKEYELTKQGVVPSDVDVAKGKWKQKAREEQLNSELVGESPTISSPELTPEGDYIQGVIRNSDSDTKQNIIKPIIQKITPTPANLSGEEAAIFRANAIEKAKLNWNQQANKNKIGSDLIAEDINISSPEISPDGDFIHGYLTKATPNTKESIKPLLQKVEGRAGERSLISLDPVEIQKTIESVSPSEAYNLRKSIMNQVVESEKKGDAQAVAILVKAVKSIDEKISGSLTQEGKDVLTTGQQRYGNSQDMLNSVKSLDDIAKQSDTIKKGKFEDVKAKKDAKRKLSGLSETSQDLRSALESQAKDYGFGPEINKLLEQTRFKELAEAGDVKSALSMGGALVGPLHSALIKSSNLVGMGAKSMLDVSSKITNNSVANTLRSIANEVNPAVRQALIRQYATEDNKELNDALAEYNASQEPQEASEMDQVPMDNSAPERSPAGIYNIPIVTDFNHLETSEGDATVARSKDVIVPGKTGIYNDSKGNPTTMYGANLNSSATQKAYNDLEIDPYNATEQEHKQVAAHNWREHAIVTRQTLKNMGLSLKSVPQHKQQPLLFLFEDMGYNGGPSVIKSQQRLVDMLNKGDVRTFQREFLNSSFYRNNPSRQKSLLEYLKKL